VACQQFPTLPAVPETVDPDRWLVQRPLHAFARTIRVGGDLTINHQDYYVSRNLAGQRVTCWVNAAEKDFEIWQPGGLIKSIPIKGLYGKTMPAISYRCLGRTTATGGYPIWASTQLPHSR
jgi:hypothetical protein